MQVLQTTVDTVAQKERFSFFTCLTTATKRPAPASSSGCQEMQIEETASWIRFVVTDIPIIGELTLEVPSQHTVDSMKQHIVDNCATVRV